MSKERPILFSGPMVRALLDGSKTQTRRVVKPQPIADARFVGGYYVPGPKLKENSKIAVEAPYVHLACPYGQPGDRLWVRETFVMGWPLDETGMVDQYDDEGKEKPRKAFYRATSPDLVWCDGGDDCPIPTPWKPSIHMPRAASRITLEITRVRVERLQDISADDARAEGCPDRPIPGAEQASVDLLAKLWYHDLWEQINGPDSWAANPWVWVVEFRRLP